MSEMGGLFVFVYVIGFLLTRCFINHSLDKNLIYDSYQEQGYKENSSEFYKSLEVRKAAKDLRKKKNKKKKKKKSKDSDAPSTNVIMPHNRVEIHVEGDIE